MAVSLEWHYFCVIVYEILQRTYIYMYRNDLCHEFDCLKFDSLGPRHN